MQCSFANRDCGDSRGKVVGEEMALRERLEHFDLDVPNSHLKFSERLARENNWTIRHARRVIVEYKRFLELAVTAGHTVTPSDDVDQAWHLHMVYTRSYWEELCQEVLRQPLHHGPTKGGQRERDRYEDLYAKTKESYCRIFGESPPADIWPESEERFRQSIQSVRVDRGRNWVIPKPAIAQVAGACTLASAPLAVVGTDILLGAGLFDADGSTFLLFYLILFAIALTIGFMLRSRLRKDPGMGQVPPSPEKVGWAASAVLAGGYNRAVMAVIARLRSEGRVNLVKNKLVADVKFAQGLATPTQSAGWSPASATPATAAKTIGDTQEDLAILNSAEKLICAKESGIKIDKFAKSLHSELNRTSIFLEQLDLWSSSGERLSRGLATAGPLGFLFLIGLARCFLGVTRDRPIGFLVLLLVVTGIACIAFLASFPRRTKLGDHSVQQLQAKYPKSNNGKDLDRDKNSQTADYNPVMDAPFRMGLYGAAFMSGSAIGDDAAFYNMLKTQSGSMPGGDGGAVFNGGGCRGDGGGDAGCGGGCGGCGG